jgi:signal recognition particle receptor subunit alpha
MFQVAYQRIIQLTYVEHLLEAMRTLFIKLFQPFLATFVASLHNLSITKPSIDLSVNWDFKKTLQEWNDVFDKVLRGLEDKASMERRTRLRSAPMQHTYSASSVDELANGSKTTHAIGNHH